MSNIKRVYLSLPVECYEELSEISKVKNISATEPVRNVVIKFLQEEERKSVAQNIEKFALKFGGSEIDLDKDFEEASLEFITKV